MYYAYVLKSINHDYYNKGHCFDLEKRILQLNSGLTVSIRPYTPLQLVYAETFDTDCAIFYLRTYFRNPAAGWYFIFTARLLVAGAGQGFVLLRRIKYLLKGLFVQTGHHLAYINIQYHFAGVSICSFHFEWCSHHWLLKG